MKHILCIAIVTTVLGAAVAAAQSNPLIPTDVGSIWEYVDQTGATEWVVATGTELFQGEAIFRLDSSDCCGGTVFHSSFKLTLDAAGNLYFSDTFNHRIRRVDARSFVISTIAGNGQRSEERRVGKECS